MAPAVTAREGNRADGTDDVPDRRIGKIHSNIEVN
jgi:hypothetical protein